MIKIGLKAMVLQQGGGEAIQIAVVQRCNLAAGTAYQVVVAFLTGPLKLVIVRAHVGLVNQLQHSGGRQGTV